MAISAPKAFAKDPTMYILRGLASYETVQHQLKIVSKKVQKTTGLSKKSLVHISGTISQVVQKKFSTKLLNISSNIDNISIKPVFEYSLESNEAVASVGINYSF